VEFHHLGIACKKIDKALKNIERLYNVVKVSDIVHDELQSAHLCLITTDNGMVFELISGDQVDNILKKGLSYYHVCYCVDNLEEEIDKFISNGSLLIKPPTPAKLFNDQKVAFLLTDIGMVELLEKG
jgi:hypothetical protein